jgi:hypothetical protein
MNNQMLRKIGFGILVVLFIAIIGLLTYPEYRAGTPLPMLLINTLILAVPTGVVCLSLGLIFEAWQQHRAGKVGPRIEKYIYFTPRIAGLLIALFIGLFALDVFDMPGSVWQKIGAFLMHAAPALVMLVLLVLAWRWPWVGTVTFGVAALLFLFLTVIGGGQFSLGNLLLFALPLSLVAALFWLNWRWRVVI